MSTPTDDEIQQQLDAAFSRSSLFSRPGFLIRRLHQIHTSLFLDETREYNITPVQYSLITTLAALGEMDQSSLAQEIGLERTSVAEVIPRLEQRELLERRRSSEDRRVKLVRLRPQGYQLLEQMRPLVQRAHDRTIEALPEGERKRFLLQLIQLVEANNHLGNAPFKPAARRPDARKPDAQT